MLGKVRQIWGEERWGVGMGREEGEQLKEIVGLVGDPSEVYVSQNSGRRGEENNEGKRGMKKGNETQGCVVYA